MGKDKYTRKPDGAVAIEDYEAFARAVREMVREDDLSESARRGAKAFLFAWERGCVRIEAPRE